MTPDPAAKLPGRGVWVTCARKPVLDAVKKGAFARSLKGPAKADAALADAAEAALARRCLDLIGLARRAGVLSMGRTSVETALRAGAAHLLIEAKDSAENDRGKLLRLAHGLGSRAPLAACFSAAELGMALGRDRVVHACVSQERMAQRLAGELARLSGFRALVPHSWPQASRIGGSTSDEG